jgi:hypothetical protein
MKVYINAEDIAAANISLSLSQALLDMAVRNKLIEPTALLELLDQMATQYEKPGQYPLRANVRASAAKVLRMIASKYDVPPKSQQN